MDASLQTLSEIAQDHPIESIARRRVFGKHILFAEVHLSKGCHVAPHRHVSEQIAYVVRGKLKWTLGEPGTLEHREVIAIGGTVVTLPSNFLHGVDALEDTLVIDLLSPPGEMGVDRQDAAH